MKLNHLLSAVAALVALTANAQQKKEVDIWNPPVQKGIINLKVGDMLPDFKISVILNGDKKNAMSAEFNDRLLIFDFGNTQCQGCVAALPHMDSLEQQFGNKLRIFWVSPESSQKMQKFWSTNKYVKNTRLQTIAEDSTVRAYFRHQSWPHEAWVYKGRVIAITGPEYVDADNIGKVLRNEPVNWPVKDDFYVFDGTKQPLFALGTNQASPSSVKRYAAISDYKEGVNGSGFTGGSGIVRDPVHKTVRYFFLNQPVYNSYAALNTALSVGIQRVKPQNVVMIGANEVAWEVKDAGRYQYISKEVSGYTQDWIRKNGICFESLNTDTGQTNTQVYQSAWHDLNALLGLDVHWEKRKEKVLVLWGKGSKLKVNRSTNPEDPGYSSKGNLHQFRNVLLDVLVYKLNQQQGNPYVFNETGIKERVDLDLDIPSWTDIPSVRKALSVYGLDLKEEERLVDKLVFKEVPARLPLQNHKQKN